MSKVLRKCFVCGTLWKSHQEYCPNCGQIDTTIVGGVGSSGTDLSGKQGKPKANFKRGLGVLLASNKQKES